MRYLDAACSLDVARRSRLPYRMPSASASVSVSGLAVREGTKPAGGVELAKNRELRDESEILDWAGVGRCIASDPPKRHQLPTGAAGDSFRMVRPQVHGII